MLLFQFRCQLRQAPVNLLVLGRLNFTILRAQTGRQIDNLIGEFGVFGSEAVVCSQKRFVFSRKVRMLALEPRIVVRVFCVTPSSFRDCFLQLRERGIVLLQARFCLETKKRLIGFEFDGFRSHR